MVDWKKVSFLAAVVVLSLVFLAAGVTKLMGQDPNPENFETWGYPSWMMYVVGAAEVVFAILLAVPKTRFFGGALLVANMIGAAITHIRVGEYPMIGANVVLGGLAFFVAWLTMPPQVASRLNRDVGVYA